MNITSLGTYTVAGLTDELEADAAGVPSKAVTLQAVATGEPTSVIMDVEASLDGVSWGLVDTHTFTAEELTALNAVFTVVDKPTRLLRVNIKTLAFTLGLEGDLTIKGLV